ncbi:MAG: hypothetical protein WD851_13845 [Pirellulales bacterium]
MNQLSFVPDDWPDDDAWEVFLPDGDPYAPEPAPGDFWIGDQPDEFERLAA